MFIPFRKRLNLPFQKIHHIQHGYGRLIFPWGKQRRIVWFWLAWFGVGWRVVTPYDFHNCTRTGIY